jgi:putative redox protein
MPEGWTEVSTSWVKENSYIATSANGGTVQMGTIDGKPGIGPMSLLLAAVAGCTGMDIVDILKKKKIDLQDFKIKVRGHRATDYPMIWTEIHLDYQLWGENIPPKDLEQAIHLSETKYCCVGIMLGQSAKITSEYHILKPGESPAQGVVNE